MARIFSAPPKKTVKSLSFSLTSFKQLLTKISETLLEFAFY